MAVRLAEKFSVKRGRLPAMTRFELGEAERLACLTIGEALDRFFQQSEMDVLSFQPMVIVQAVCIDERRATASVLGNEFLAPGCPSLRCTVRRASHAPD